MRQKQVCNMPRVNNNAIYGSTAHRVKRVDPFGIGLISDHINDGRTTNVYLTDRVGRPIDDLFSDTRLFLTYLPN